MSMGEICNRNVVVTAQNSSLFEAAELMRNHHVGDLVVVEEGNGNPVPAGIMTDRDIVFGVLAKRTAPGAFSVGMS